MNSTQLIGRWTREHDTNTSTNGTVITKNTLAVDHPFKKDDSSFIRIVMFGKTGELAAQYTGKGSLVAISGHIQTGDYTNKDGVKVYTTDVIANSIKFLEPKNHHAAPRTNEDFDSGLPF